MCSRFRGCKSPVSPKRTANAKPARSAGVAVSGLSSITRAIGICGYAREAAREAILNLSAVEAPAGVMPVVLGGGWPGILLHEAIGHGLEADFNRKKTSAFSNLLGKRVASEVCTIVDDGTLPGRRGSLNMDDEGTPTGRTVLIEQRDSARLYHR